MKIDHLIRSKRRTLALLVRRDGTLEVRAPLRMPLYQIETLIAGKSDWVIKRRVQMARLSKSSPPHHYQPGEEFLYLGKMFPLILAERSRPALALLEDGFHLARTARKRGSAAFTAWYKAEARRVFEERTALYAARFSLKAHGVRITAARTRWGSCGPQGSLNFTWRLVMAPLEILDYVVVHELAHLKIRSHSAAFWKLVAEMMPDYQTRRDWLKKNGHCLTLDS